MFDKGRHCLNEFVVNERFVNDVRGPGNRVCLGDYTAAALVNASRFPAPQAPGNHHVAEITSTISPSP